MVYEKPTYEELELEVVRLSQRNQELVRQRSMLQQQLSSKEKPIEKFNIA